MASEHNGIEQNGREKNAKPFFYILIDINWISIFAVSQEYSRMVVETMQCNSIKLKQIDSMEENGAKKKTYEWQKEIRQPTTNNLEKDKKKS